MLLVDFIKTGMAMLEDIYPSPEARGLISMLCEDRLGVKNYTHIVEPAYEIPLERLEPLLSDLERLKASEPIQYVLGWADFCGRNFKTSPGVLIPRPETEMMVLEAERMLKEVMSPCVLDLCTGSGCIAWTMAQDNPKAVVYAADISEKALTQARSQFSEGNTPQFVQMDVLRTDTESQLPFFDAILCNPPYIMESEKDLMRANVLEYEPAIALFVPDDDPLLFYRAVASWSNKLLKPSGFGIVEINEQFPDETAGIFSGAGFGEVIIMDDFFGKPRFVRYRKKA